MTDLENAFNATVIALAKDPIPSSLALQVDVAKNAKKVFGEYKSLLVDETAKNYFALEEYPHYKLENKIVYKSLALPFFANDLMQDILLSYGWDVRRVAKVSKQIALSRWLEGEEYAGYNLLGSFVKDRVYRIGEIESPNIILESLNRLYVIEAKVTTMGVMQPLRVVWLKDGPIKNAQK